MMNEYEKKGDENEIIILKAKTFLKEGCQVHIKLKRGMWKNGFIKELKGEYFLIDERLEGSLTIFYSECLNIERYVQKGGNQNDFK